MYGAQEVQVGKNTINMWLTSSILSEFWALTMLWESWLQHYKLSELLLSD